MSTRPRRSWRRKVVALALSCVVSFLIGEVFARAFYGVPLPEHLPIMMMEANPNRGWAMVPGKDHYTYTHRVRVNALGLRGAEVGDKQPGEARVLVLGDSLVYGQGVGDDYTMPAALQRSLARRQPGRTWSVVNAGHRAYDTRQELALLEELGPRVAPDVVVLCWFWNDFQERDIAQTYARLQGRGELAFDTANKLEGLDWLAWQAKQLVRSSAFVMVLHDFLRSRDLGLSPEDVQQGLQRLHGYLERMQGLSAGWRFDLVVALVPDANVMNGNQETVELGRRAGEVAQRLGIRLVDLQPAIEAQFRKSKKMPVVPFDGHYDEAGNAAMAELLAERLIEAGFPARNH
jgi:lysophospholipase L1-like esterase